MDTAVVTKIKTDKAKGLASVLIEVIVLMDSTVSLNTNVEFVGNTDMEQ